MSVSFTLRPIRELPLQLMTTDYRLLPTDFYARIMEIGTFIDRDILFYRRLSKENIILFIEMLAFIPALSIPPNPPLKERGEGSVVWECQPVLL